MRRRHGGAEREIDLSSASDFRIDAGICMCIRWVYIYSVCTGSRLKNRGLLSMSRKVVCESVKLTDSRARIYAGMGERNTFSPFIKRVYTNVSSRTRDRETRFQ